MKTNRLKLLIFIAMSLVVGCEGKMMDRHLGSDSRRESKPRVKTLELSSLIFNESLDTYQDCQELRSDLAGQIEKINAYHHQMREKETKSRQDAVRSNVPSAQDRSTIAMPDNDSGQEENVAEISTKDEIGVTNVQEDGVDEADFVKRNKFHIYVLHGGLIEVLDRGSLNIISRINTGMVAGSGNRFDIQIYTYGNRLVVVGYAQSVTGLIQPRVKIYESTDGKTPKEVKDVPMPGSLVQSRFINGIFYGVYGDSVGVSYVKPNLSLSSPNMDHKVAEGTRTRFWRELSLKEDQFSDSKFRQVPCGNIVKAAANDWNPQMAHLISLDTRNLESETSLKTVSVMNTNPQNIYVGQHSIYFFSSQFSSPFYSVNGRFTAITEIRYDVENGNLQPIARGKVPGYPGKEQWSFKQLSDGYLGLVTTTSAPISKDQLIVSEDLRDGRNHLWLLKPQDKGFELTGSVINLGKPHEDVRSVRYIDDKAYIVTFEKTDPLYTVNLSDRSHPKVEDALEIPGFSMYMHPINDHFMVGVGFDAVDMGSYSLFQGIQVSLFRLEEEKSVLADKKIYGARGSSSEVTGDHKAFYFDEDSLTFAIPLVEVKHADTNASPRSFGTQQVFSGAIIFGLSDEANGMMEEKARISHQDIIPEPCRGRAQSIWWSSAQRSQDINRMFRHEGHLISVSRYGLKSHDLSTYEEKKVVTFGTEPDCIVNIPNWND